MLVYVQRWGGVEGVAPWLRLVAGVQQGGRVRRHGHVGDEGLLQLGHFHAAAAGSGAAAPAAQLQAHPHRRLFKGDLPVADAFAV